MYIPRKLTFKKALGHKPESYEWGLQNFDRFCSTHYPNTDILTKELAFAWCNDGKEYQKSGYRMKIIRELGKYLVSLGNGAFIYPSQFIGQTKADLPYILTDTELKNFFSASDNYPNRSNSPLLKHTVPMIFRLQYACGMRPQEVRRLKRTDFDFKKDTIYISESKWNKDRRLAVNNELMVMCRRYDFVAHSTFPDRHYFFPSQSGGIYSHGWLTATFHKCWELSANETVRGKCVPYDLRHNFATRTLMRWTEEGKDLDVYIPYLSTYMGHATFRSTYYYVHLMPERLSSMKFMGTNGIIPEVHSET
jgi:integrase